MQKSGITKHIIRKDLKALGANASIKKHGLIDNGVKIIISGLGIGTANVFSRETVENNQKVFDYVNSLEGVILDDTGERII